MATYIGSSMWNAFPANGTVTARTTTNAAASRSLRIERTYLSHRPSPCSAGCGRASRRDAPNCVADAGLLLYPDGVCRRRGWEEKDMGQYDRPEEVLAPHGCAAAYHRRMLEDVGGFDEAYFCYLEDLDLGMRGQL